MASLYRKVINGKPYYYLREMGWVDGKPKMVSERYLGSVAEIVKAMDAAEAGMMPQRTGHLAFGDVAAAWSLITDLDVAGVIDDVVGARRSDAGASIGTYRRWPRWAGWWRRGRRRHSPTGGPPPPRTGSPGSAGRSWTTVGSGMPCTPWMPKPCRRSRPGWRDG